MRLTNATAWHRAETGAAKSIPGEISWCLSKLTEEVYINITWLSSAAFVSTAHLEILPCWAAWGTGQGGKKGGEKKIKKKRQAKHFGFERQHLHWYHYQTQGPLALSMQNLCTTLGGQLLKMFLNI